MEGKIAEIVDGKCVIYCKDDLTEMRDVHLSHLSGSNLTLDCMSAPGANEGEVVGLPTNDVGGFDYDVLVLFDSSKKEVRASVGWGCTGSRMDKCVVPSEMWPSSELPLVPFVSLDHEDFCGMNNVCERVEQLPITVEALTRKQMAEEAISTLLHG